MCRMKAKLLYDKIKYELPIFLLLLIQTIPQNLDFSEDPYASLLAVDYGILGFAPRVFPGSVMALFFDYRGSREINIFFSVIFILTFLLVSWMAGRLIRSADDDIKKVTIFFVALFLAGPYSSAVFFPQIYAPDRLLVLFTLLGLLIMNIRLVKWLLPFILFAALATHSIFTFTFMPAFVVLLLYELYESGYSKSNRWFCAINYLSMFSFTAYFYLFPGLQRMTLDELIAYAGTKTDVLIREDMFEGYFFADPHRLFAGIQSYMSANDVIRSEYRAILFFLPLIILFLFIWKNSFSASENKLEKFIFILCIFVPLARIPLFPINSEVYRGRVAVIFVQFTLLLYFLYRRNPAVTKSVKKLGEFLQRNTLLMFLLIGYFAMAFAALDFSEPWRALFEALIAPVI